MLTFLPPMKAHVHLFAPSRRLRADLPGKRGGEADLAGKRGGEADLGFEQLLKTSVVAQGAQV